MASHTEKPDDQLVVFQDDYCHILNQDLYYVEENVPSQYRENDPDSIKIHRDFNSQQTSHCKCENICSLGSCACIAYSGTSYVSFGCNVVMSEAMLTTDRPIFECNDMCPCSAECGNRLVQLGPRLDLKIVDLSKNKKSQNATQDKPTHTKGLGLITVNPIPKGGFVCEYAGEIITKLEATERDQMNERLNLMNYIICVNEYTGEKKYQTFIDPSKFGNIGRYLNHSCNPNCFISLIRVNNPIPKLCLFANTNINANTELTFDYGSKINNPSSDNPKKIPCLCKSSICKKWLPNALYN